MSIEPKLLGVGLAASLWVGFAPAAGASEVFVLDADPFRDSGARLVGRFEVSDWTSNPDGLPGGLSVGVERFTDPAQGLQWVGAVTLAPLPAGAAFALVNQVDPDLSVFAARTLAATAPDADGNGIADAWERAFFGQVGVDPEADPDADGAPNVEEARAGTDPTDDLSRPGVPGGLARWAGEGDSLDALGHHPGIWGGDPGFVPGIVGRAFAFSGSNQVRVADSALFRPETEFTVAAWVRLSSVSADRSPVLVRPSSNAGLPGIGLFMTSGGPRLFLGSATASRFDGPDTPILAEVWYHVAATWMPGTVRIYLDGALASTASYSPSALGTLDLPPGKDLLLGQDGHTGFLKGALDELVFASRVLSAEEVRRLAGRGQPGWRAEFAPVARSPEGGWMGLRFAVPAGAPGIRVEAARVLGGGWEAIDARAVEEAGRAFLEVPIEPGDDARYFRLKR